MIVAELTPFSLPSLLTRIETEILDLNLRGNLMAVTRLSELVDMAYRVSTATVAPREDEKLTGARHAAIWMDEEIKMISRHILWGPEHEHRKPLLNALSERWFDTVMLIAGVESWQREANTIAVNQARWLNVLSQIRSVPDRIEAATYTLVTPDLQSVNERAMVALMGARLRR